MEGAIARAQLVDLTDDSAPRALTATLPRHEVEEALRADDGPMDLVLDVARYPEGKVQSAVTERIAISWDEKDLEDLLRRAEGDSVTLAFDGEALLQALDVEVEGHGIREAAAVLAVAVAAGVGAGAAAAAEPDAASGGPGTASAIEQGYSAIEQLRVESGAVPAASAGTDIEALRAGEAASLAGAQAASAGTDIEALRAGEAANLAAAQGTPAGIDIEALRAGEAANLAGAQAASAGTDIEALRASEAARLAATSPGTTADTGLSISLPGPETTAALVGGIALLITGAAFAARTRRLGVS